MAAPDAADGRGRRAARRLHPRAWSAGRVVGARHRPLVVARVRRHALLRRRARCRRAAPAPAGVPGYARAEAFTYLTLPEWYIVYSADEYARVRRDGAPPSAFPYLGAVAPVPGAPTARCARRRRGALSVRGRLSRHARRHRRRASPSRALLKALYENTRRAALTEWLSSTDTPEDRVRARGSRGVRHVHAHDAVVRVPVRDAAGGVVDATCRCGGPHAVRKWERRAGRCPPSTARRLSMAG